MRNYRDQPPKCVIYINPYKIKDYYCGVAKYNKKKKKIYVHVTTKYANYGKTHFTNFLYYISKYKVDIKARKKKIKKKEVENKCKYIA